MIALAAGDRRQLFCSTSAVGYYGPREEEVLTEDSPPGAGFLNQLSVDWEAEALKARELGDSGGDHPLRHRLGEGRRGLGADGPHVPPIFGRAAGLGATMVFLDSPGGPRPGPKLRPGASRNPRSVNFTAPYPVRNRELAGPWARRCTGPPSWRHRPS